jgi:Fur family ferric uptake transcriptional regulator
MTPQRQVILEELNKLEGHPTADEVYFRVRDRFPRISLGTVYRNLDILATCGLIRKLEPDFPQMRFDRKVSDHYHVTCMQCGKIEDASLDPMDNSIENLEKALGNLTKHGIFGHKLEFVGLCQECLKREKELEGEWRYEFERKSD